MASAPTISRHGGRLPARASWLCPIALNRKNALSAGHDAGAKNWAMIASLIETCKLNRIDPQA
jgi:hypothetical protein